MAPFFPLVEQLRPIYGKKRWGQSCQEAPSIKMLPSSYQICFQQQLKKTEYLTLTILVFLLQTHKQVSIELLATLMPYPIMFESRRRGIQRFLKLPILKIEKLWFPLIKYILRMHFKNKKQLMVAIDRTSVAGPKYLCD